MYMLYLHADILQCVMIVYVCVLIMTSVNICCFLFLMDVYANTMYVSPLCYVAWSEYCTSHLHITCHYHVVQPKDH